jgi:hypothetical protein
MNLEQARQTPVGITDGQFKALTNGWKYSPEELLGLNKETASELLDACSRAGHKLDGEDYAAFKETEALQDRSAIEKRGFLAPVIIDRSLDRLFSDLPAGEKEEEYELRQSAACRFARSSSGSAPGAKVSKLASARWASAAPLRFLSASYSWIAFLQASAAAIFSCCCSLI